MPRSVIALPTHSARIIKDPTYLYSRGLSDHSPVFRCVSAPEPSPPCSPFKMKGGWCIHPHHASRMAAFGPIITASAPDPSETRRIMLEAMGESARQSRDLIFLEQPECNHSKLIYLASFCLRAAWSRGVKLASIFFENNALGTEVSEVRRAAITLNNPSSFEQQSLEAKQYHFDQAKAELVSAGTWANYEAPGVEKRANAAWNQLSALCTARSPGLALAGVIISEDMLTDSRLADIAIYIQANMVPYGSDEFVVAQQDHVMRIIAGEWEQVFFEEAICEETASELLNEYGLIERWD